MSNHLYSELSSRFGAPNKAAFISPGNRITTYRDIDVLSARFANALTALGVVPGDRVAVQIEKSVEAVLLYLGVVRAGGVFLPLNTAYTANELDYFLRDAEPRVFVCDPAREAALKSVASAAGVKHIETLGTKGDGSLIARARLTDPNRSDAKRKDPDRGPDDLSGILYTSGTTGRSKGAMLSQENLASNARMLLDFWRFTADDVLIHALPIYHTHGLFVATNTLLMAGGTMLFQPKFDADEVIALLPKATSMMGVPTFYTRLLQHPCLTPEATKHMRLFISGSAPLLAETHREWFERTGHHILERYGMTETNMNTSNPYEGARVAGTVGPPLPGVDLRVADPETGALLAQGEIGMIEVRGANVFKGYWRMPEKTKAEFRDDGFFITGDLGKIDDAGYVHIVGRGKDLVITGGFNVYPKEIESEIDAIEGVVESAVIGVPHRDFGEGVTAIVVRSKNATVDETAITRVLNERLAKFKQPKRIIFLDDLPRNTMGKVQKNVLREQYKDLYSA